jgi:hypothetical protein
MERGAIRVSRTHHSSPGFRFAPSGLRLCYLDIHEDDQLDEAQLAAWAKQASQLPACVA